MKNIDFRYVNEIAEWVNDYKRLSSLWDITLETCGYKTSEKIREAISEQMFEKIDYITLRLSQLYDDWCGVNKAAFIYRAEHGTYDGFDEIRDELHEKYESDGMCEYITLDDADIKIGNLPVSFMKEFCEEYGIFEMRENNVVIL